ncbi:Putative major intrinsic protein [Septoria linicola]|uniref:Major intrinsic protein n=1 Tax=Septoria linicola TaxID=215465 RepID=A0A9Q9AJP5_9PEZI|nr:putative major intrinsic protein [Septoria linicola]USW47398.1 Putative major intrinsic protein [Septoria linicola]
MAGLAKPPHPDEQSQSHNHFAACSGEFVGTFQFLLFAFLGHTMAVDPAPNTALDGSNSNQTVIFIALSYGFGLLVTAWTLYRVSGGLFNPAVTLGLALTGNLPMIRAALFIPTQLLAGVCAAAVASCIIPGDIAGVQTTLGNGVSMSQGLFIEMFLTSWLTFTILMLAAEKSKDTFLAPIGIGMALFVTQIADVYYTGGSLNPARSFGPCVAAASSQGYHWIYWSGPGLGAILAAGYYHFVKFFNHERANPGQDSANGHFAPHKDELHVIPGVTQADV